jgi:hypothetical protein
LSLLFPIGAVFTKEKRWKETKSQTESLDSEPQTESLDSEPQKPLSKNKKSCNSSTEKASIWKSSMCSAAVW